MTQEEWDAYAKDARPIVCRFDDQLMNILPKVFSTGSVGWYANGKAKILVGQTYLPVQVSLTLTIIGSKNFASQQTAQNAPEEPIGPLLGPEYPWNESAQEGPVLGQEMASGEQEPNVEVNGKPAKAKKKGSKR